MELKGYNLGSEMELISKNQEFALDKLIAHLYNGAGTSKIRHVGKLQAKQSPLTAMCRGL